jgi:hypothetical protein
MADLHVKNTGSTTSPFDTWAKAAGNLGTVTGAAAGDRYLLSSAHAGSTTGYTITFPGTPANPNLLLCGTEAGASGISAMAATAVETITGTTFTLNGSFYAEGIIWDFTSTSSGAPNYAANNGAVQRFKNCSFRYTGAAGSPQFLFGTLSSGAASSMILENCGIRGPSANFNVGIEREVTIRDGAWESGGTSPTYCFNVGVGNKPVAFLVDGFDFTNIGNSTNIVGAIGEGSCNALLRRCKFGASWAGSLVASGQIKPGTRVEMYDYQIGSNLRRVWIEQYEGTVKSENTIKVGADFSYKVVTNSNIKYPLGEVEVFDAYRSLTSGAAKTFKLYTLTDGVTLTNADVALRAEYFDTSGSYLGTFISSSPASVITTATSLTTNSVSWASAPGTPVKQEVTLTFTPAQTGFCIISAIVTRPSTTLYLDNTLTES